jgi:hypothetical protein
MKELKTFCNSFICDKINDYEELSDDDEPNGNEYN